MSKQQSKEKRVHTRTVLNRLVRVTTHNGQTLQRVGINYSPIGLAFSSNIPIPAGEFIELDFKLNEKKEKAVNITAEVVQNFKDGCMYVTGVRFLGELKILENNVIHTVN